MFPLGKRLRVVKHCPEGHVMKVNWRTCPKCTGEEPELIRARGDLDRTVIRPAAPREPAPTPTPAARPAAVVTTQPPRAAAPPPAAPAPPAYVPPAAPAPPAYVPPAAPAPPAYVPPAAPAPPAPPVPPVPHVVVWQLVGTEGAVKGRTIVLSGPCVKIGKSPVPEAGARLETVDDAFMSREHLAVEPQGDAWIVRDLGSRNGTVVNDEHVQERVLKHGDVVRAGHLAFRVERIEREAGA